MDPFASATVFTPPATAFLLRAGRRVNVTTWTEEGVHTGGMAEPGVGAVLYIGHRLSTQARRESLIRLDHLLTLSSAVRDASPALLTD